MKMRSSGKYCSSEFHAKGAVLERGEEGIQFSEVGALRCLLSFGGFDDGGEILLDIKGRERKLDAAEEGLVDLVGAIRSSRTGIDLLSHFGGRPRRLEVFGFNL